MILDKSVIASLAINKFSELTGSDEFFQTSPACGFIQYAFTKDCTLNNRDYLLETMYSISDALSMPRNLWCECPMSAVTRNSELWDK